ncbi:hypothetical protein [Nodularia spumigena]|uniref:hypothetical protein n=1 Tax=Nodularia spumigena TaxID=70799 RepID=UPI002330E0AE|nr:hypothetical protein [Nodularia spumigena]MDB9324538.1 hypothetical protein [Nodularia spumigena CS-591/07A]MDB9328464.1 hypothetical protein [Nodularia spumigena CS-590/02]MDB9362936.1 hypothetical protein [Nodularia spumigena CS-588/02]
MVKISRAIATIPLIKFNRSGGICCPTIPYTTEAIAHKPAAAKAANSPLPFIKELLKISFPL